MDINLILGIAGIALSVISLIYAIHVTRVSKREKYLVYEVLEAVPIAQVINRQRGYSLQLIYEQPDSEPLSIEHAFVQYVRLINFGRVPIKKEDLASADPLRIEVKPKGGQVLDISLLGVTRETCKVDVGKPESRDELISALIDFEFLDFLDGCLIQILSDASRIEISLNGTIVGMPEGIQKKVDVSEGRPFTVLGCIFGGLIEIAAIVVAAYIFHRVMGDWGSIWILGLPLIPLIVAPIIIGLFMMVIGSRTGLKFPKRLVPPEWYHFQLMSRREIMRRRTRSKYIEEENKQ